MSNPLELPFSSLSGKVQDPSQSLEMATNNHQLMPMFQRCSKPSRWRQPPRVTRNPQPQRSPSSTKCNHLSKCTRNHSQSHYDDESMTEMSGRYLLRLTRMLRVSKCHESEPQADQGLFKEPLGSKSHWAVKGAPDALNGCYPASDH
jgi:hypothetical protein